MIFNSDKNTNTQKKSVESLKELKEKLNVLARVSASDGGAHLKPALQAVNYS